MADNISDDGWIEEDENFEEHQGEREIDLSQGDAHSTVNERNRATEEAKDAINIQVQEDEVLDVDTQHQRENRISITSMTNIASSVGAVDFQPFKTDRISYLDGGMLEMQHEQEDL